MQRQLLLNELIGGERPVELLAVERVLPRRVPAEFGSPHCAPADAVARIVATAERPGQALHLRQQAVFAHAPVFTPAPPLTRAPPPHRPPPGRRPGGAQQAQDRVAQ